MDQRRILDYIDQYEGAKVKLAITDIDGILRGKIIHRDKFKSIIKGGFSFCDVVFGWDAADVCYDNVQVTGWHTGYPDAAASIDLNTFRKIPWEGDMPFFLADFVNEKGEALVSCPRNLLKKIRKQARDAGFAPKFSQEFEWFNFEESPQSLYDKHFVQPKPMTPGMFGYSILRSSLKSAYFNDLFDLLGKFDVPLEGLHTETGPGVYEAAILYGDVLTAADRATLFKTAVKEIAYRHGLVATFMAKWRVDLPGCSGHVHQSLWDEQHNLFFDEKDANNMSDLMKSYMAGQLHCLPHILPMFAPTINSYKRLVEGAWAPTTLTWGRDNRTTALRVLTAGKKSARLETRVSGSDTNPFLVMAACLASGLYGIRKGLKLEQPKVVGNGYEEKRYGVLPRNLAEATEAMKRSDLARELFGEGFVDHFVATREWEWREFAKAVTDWEFKRYFELI
ncbi:MAG: glutamine synthetase [Bacteroidetes bacterium]|nr:MAG: glutamine synthetase [Bacteroidota bacterium]